MKKTSKTNSWKSITVVLFVLVVSAVIATFVGCSNTKESPNEVAKPEIHVKFYDVVAYYGDGPVPVNFDFEIITKGYDISKDDLSKKVGINREPGLEVGKYAIIGENKDPNLDIKFQEATYEIRKASYDISDIKFPDKNVVGNGKVQRLQINGKIPDGVTVEYDNNENSAPGKYQVTARFIVDSKRYEEIPDMHATLTIEAPNAAGKVQKTVVATNQGIKKPASTNQPVKNPAANQGADKNTGNGTNLNTTTEKQKPSVIVYICDVQTVYGKPLEELDFSFINMNDNLIHKEELKKMIRLTKEPGLDAGIYKITGEIIDDSIADIKIFDGKYTIEKDTYDEAMANVSFEDKTVKANGQEHSIEISGELPDGVTVEYLNNGKSLPGSYDVIAIFSGDTKNYEPIPNRKAVLTILRASSSGNHGGNTTDDPVGPVDPDVPNVPDTPTEPAPPVDTEEPTEPAPPVVPDVPDVPNVPVVPEEPTEPAPPVDTVVPEEPTEPAPPVDPVVPEEPTEPAPPVDPVVPEEPTEPAPPVDPVVPEEPTEPAPPVDTVVPEEPTEPAPPVNTDVPDAPNAQVISEEATRAEPTVVMAMFNLFNRSGILLK